MAAWLSAMGEGETLLVAQVVAAEVNRDRAGMALVAEE